MRFQARRRRRSRPVTLLASLALFVTLCGGILLAASWTPDPGEEGGEVEVGDAPTSQLEDRDTREMIERALRNLDDAERLLGPDQEPSKIFIQRARDALRELVLALSTP